MDPERDAIRRTPMWAAERLRLTRRLGRVHDRFRLQGAAIRLLPLFYTVLI